MSMKYRNGRPYYYRNRRVAGQVVTEYAGSGRLAEYEHALQGIEVAKRMQRQLSLMDLRDQLADPPELTEFFALIRLLTHASLAAVGYRQHKRGEWRKPRD